MHPELSTSSQGLRTQLREYFAGLISEEDRADLREQHEGGPTFSRLLRQMGADGWLGLGWPEEYGGRGADPEALFVYYDECIRAAAPMSLVTLNTVAPALMKHGTPEQKEFFLPKILAGELIFAIGYTEPNAGTDLASLQTRAEIDGDEFVINGNKVFTSGATYADWIWLACRTDPDASRHRGLSVTPIVTVGGQSTTATYYENVRVPVSNLVGNLHGGWQLITDQLNHERVALASRGGIANELYDEVRAWAAETPLPSGGRVIDLPWVQATLARAYALLSASDLINLRLVADIASDSLNGGDAAGAKVIGTETVVEVYGLLQEVLGAAGLIRPGSPAAVIAGRVEMLGRSSQNNTFGGGSNEVMRELMAAKRLGMTVGARRQPASNPASTSESKRSAN
jgi:alkylation response protein AidB-like acyl-CoA dehydrogenase